MGRRSTRSSVASRPPGPRSSACRGGSPPRALLDRLRVAFLFSCSFSCLLLPAIAAAESEDQVKAAFLFNFARYVEWPESAFESEGAPIRLCLLAEGEFEDVLSKAVSGRTVGSRPVEVARISDVSEAGGCHLLFIDESVTAPASVVVGQLGSLAVFTISDREGFAAAGGIANFILVDQKIRFEINPSAARSAGLKISSSLLRLAKLVGEGGR